MKINKLSRVAGAFLAFGALSLPSQASADTVSDLINTYNAIVFGNLTSSSEVDGNVLAGGNVNGGNYAIHYPATPAGTALTVGGNLLGNINVNGLGLSVGGNIATSNLNLNRGGDVHVGGNVASNFNANFNGVGNLYVVNNVNSGVNVNANGGSAYIGGSVLGNVSANGGGTLHTGSTAPAATQPDIAGLIASAHDSLTTYSGQLAAMTADSSITQVGNKLVFNAAAGSDGVAVFDITGASMLNSASEFQFSLNGATSLVINVTGIGANLLNIAANFLGGIATTLATNTIWNFTDAENINISRQFGGTILAALANLTNSGNLEGSVIVNNLIQNAEIHYNGPTTVVATTPLPAALPLFGAALMIFGLKRRRSLRSPAS